MAAQIYKLVVVGDTGVGKTQWIRRLRGLPYSGFWISTVGCETHKLEIQTTQGLMTVYIVDTAGQEKFGGIPHMYQGCQGILALGEMQYPSSFGSLPCWISQVKLMTGDIPVVYVGTKSDIPTHRAYPRDLIRISSRIQSDVWMPLRSMLRNLSGVRDLDFIF